MGASYSGHEDIEKYYNLKDVEVNPISDNVYSIKTSSDISIYQTSKEIKLMVDGVPHKAMKRLNANSANREQPHKIITCIEINTESFKSTIKLKNIRKPLDIPDISETIHSINATCYLVFIRTFYINFNRYEELFILDNMPINLTFEVDRSCNTIVRCKK